SPQFDSLAFPAAADQPATLIYLRPRGSSWARASEATRNRGQAAGTPLLDRSLALSRAVSGARVARPLSSIQANGDRRALGPHSAASYHDGFHHYLRADRAPAGRWNSPLSAHGLYRHLAMDFLCVGIDRGFQQSDQQCAPD